MPWSMQSEERHRQTGSVCDPRRIVCFIYLLLRDVFPAGCVIEATRGARETPRTLCAVYLGHLPLFALAERMGHPQWRIIGFLMRLPDGYRDKIAKLAEQLSPDDDVEIRYENGHLATLAQSIADELTTDVRSAV